MGIIDFVKGGVQRMMIARPDDKKGLVVYKHPDQTFPFWSQLTVDEDEAALFFKDGRYMGALGAGRHTLQTQNIPFLNQLVDQFTGGNVFISELYFVKIRPQYNETFGGSIGSMRDPELDLPVTPKGYGTYSFQVVDPPRFVIEFIGQTGAANLDKSLEWVRDQLFMGLKTTLTRMIKAGQITMMDLGTASTDVARAVVADCPDLAKIGVRVLEIAKLHLSLDEADQARINEFQEQIVQAKIEARKAKIGIAQAEAEAQARQYQLDQDFANRQRYVNQVDMGRYQQYAGAEAMMGMGQGMAKGGEGAAAGMAGAGVAAGMGIGAGMMYGRGMAPGYPPPGYPPQGYPPPGYPPQQGYPPPGYPPQQGYPQQGYPPGAGAPQPYPAPTDAGAPPAGAPVPSGAVPAMAAPVAAGAPCPKCGAGTVPGARFCASCGNPIG